MNWFWINVPLMALFFAAVTGIPLWLTFRHPDSGPETLPASSLADGLALVPPLERQLALVGAS